MEALLFVIENPHRRRFAGTARTVLEATSWQEWGIMSPSLSWQSFLFLSLSNQRNHQLDFTYSSLPIVHSFARMFSVFGFNHQNIVYSVSRPSRRSCLV